MESKELVRSFTKESFHKNQSCLQTKNDNCSTQSLHPSKCAIKILSYRCTKDHPVPLQFEGHSKCTLQMSTTLGQLKVCTARTLNTFRPPERFEFIFKDGTLSSTHCLLKSTRQIHASTQMSRNINILTEWFLPISSFIALYTKPKSRSRNSVKCIYNA